MLKRVHGERESERVCVELASFACPRCVRFLVYFIVAYFYPFCWVSRGMLASPHYIVLNREKSKAIFINRISISFLRLRTLIGREKPVFSFHEKRHESQHAARTMTSCLSSKRGKLRRLCYIFHGGVVRKYREEQFDVRHVVASAASQMVALS